MHACINVKTQRSAKDSVCVCVCVCVCARARARTRVCVCVLAHTHAAFMYNNEKKGKKVMVKVLRDQEQREAYDKYKDQVEKRSRTSP